MNDILRETKEYHRMITANQSRRDANTLCNASKIKAGSCPAAEDGKGCEHEVMHNQCHVASNRTREI